MFKPIQLAAQGIGEQPQSIDDSGIKRVFMVLHGFYGNLFLTKFATGSTEGGEDQGIANARRVWAHSLREYDADTIKLALARCRQHHAEFPPSLPQFQKLCDAAKPRPVYKPAESPLAIGMSEELRAKRRAEARRLATEAAHRRREELAPKGLDLLKQCIATAVRDAGGDEVATLLQLDRIFTPRSVA